MIPANAIPTSGDRLQDLRRIELWAFRDYVKCSRSLANAPLPAASKYRGSVQNAKARWAAALRALDEAMT